MVLCTLRALAGCASTKVQPSVMIPASDTLPRPTRIAVYDFAVAAHDVSPNNAPLSRLRRALGGSQNEEELKVGRSVAGALAVELVKALEERAPRWRTAPSPSKASSAPSTRAT